mgnify:CR=1 FL=1|tara:strand:- start:479 stop:961 length:483 start_codon:yes stop_codon:yes gene_type:complete
MEIDDHEFKLEKLISKLTKVNQKITCAESCTGGLVCKILTDIGGSSAWFDRGFIVYSNQSKVDLLGVDLSIIESFGAVSEETALAMAKGALKNSEASLSVAITGIAGPGGGTIEKPLGTVCIAWVSSTFSHTTREHFQGNRDSIRVASARAALLGLYGRL